MTTEEDELPIVTVPLLTLVVVTVVTVVDGEALDSEPVTAPTEEPSMLKVSGAVVGGTLIDTEVSVSGQTVVECGMMEVMVEAGQLETEEGQA